MASSCRIRPQVAPRGQGPSAIALATVAGAPLCLGVGGTASAGPLYAASLARPQPRPPRLQLQPRHARLGPILRGARFDAPNLFCSWYVLRCAWACCAALNARKACSLRVVPLTRARAPSSVCSQLCLLTCCIDCAAAAGGEAPPPLDFAAAAGVALAAAGAVAVGAVGGYVGAAVLGAREFSFGRCILCLLLCLGQIVGRDFFAHTAPPHPHAVWMRQRKTRWARMTLTRTART